MNFCSYLKKCYYHLVEKLKKITILSPTYNEEENIDELVSRIVKVFVKDLIEFDYEIIFIDNASTDETVAKIKSQINKNSKIKLIVNMRNYGHIRSPFYGLQQTNSSATILLASDLQDPPELIYDLVKKWDEGYKLVLCTKPKSDEGFFINRLRKLYYKIMKKFAEFDHIENFTGFGLYDYEVIQRFKEIDDIYPYMRGIVSEIPYKKAYIDFHQPLRKKGKTKNNWLTLVDMALLGMTHSTKLPLRLVTITGLIFSFFSFLTAVGYFIFKILYWDEISFGITPLILGFFVFASLQMLFLGIIGEYISSINTKMNKKKIVEERERINF